MLRKENAAFPFCSPRCKQRDLGKWFTGAYAVPGPAVSESELEQSELRKLPRDDDEQPN